MDRHELIIGFVKEIRDLMLRQDFPESVFKQKKSEYFQIRFRKSGQGIPRNKEIAHEAMAHLIRIGFLQSVDRLDDVLALPFFSENLPDATLYQEMLQVAGKSKPDIDTSGLSRLEYEERIHQKMRNRVYEEERAAIEAQKSAVEAEYDRRISTKKKIYEEIPSVLDGIEPGEPPVHQEGQYDEDTFEPWWKRLHMVGDPFPSKGGLRDISKEFYEIVLYKTRIYLKYQHLVRNVKSEAFKNTIIFGHFGSGKTTFFEFLERILCGEGIPVLFLQQHTHGSLEALRIRFKQKLINKIESTLGASSDSLESDRFLGDLDQQLISLLRKHLQSNSTQGIVVIVDDLHKNVDEYRISLEFLNYLQILTETIKREIPGLRISFFVSGAHDWKHIIETEPRYSGSFANQDCMDDIAPSDAHQMLNLRLEPFWPNRELRRSVRMEFVEQEFANLKKTGLPITYRNFISWVVDKFKNDEFDILSSDPVRIGWDTRKAIIDMLESDGTIKDRFDRFLSRVEQPVNRMKTLKALIHVFLNNGISDRDSMVLDMKYHFKTLSAVQLIQKAKTRGGGWKWVVAPKLLRKNDQIMAKFQLSLESYLIALYSEYSQKPAGTSEEVEHIEKLTVLSDNDEMREHLVRLKEIHETIANELRYPRPRKPDSELTDLCLESIRTLSLVYFEFLDPILGEEDPISQWKNYWYSPQEIQQFLKSISEVENPERSLYAITTLYRQTFATVLSFIINQMERARDYSIETLDLTNTESSDLEMIQEKWKERLYSESAGILRRLMRKRSRAFIHNLFCLLYGEYSNRLKHVPGELREKLPPESVSASYGAFSGPNELESLGLRELAEIIAGSKNVISYENWVNVFSHVFRDFKSDNIFEILRNIEAMPDRKTFDDRAVRDLRMVILQATELLRNMNRAYVYLMTNPLHQRAESGENTFFFGFGAEIRGGLALIPATCSAFGALMESLNESPLPLDDPEFIESAFACPYRVFFGFLALGIAGEIVDACELSIKLELVHKKGPNVVVKQVDAVSSGWIAERLVHKLMAISPGRESWRDYEEACLQIINHLFSPPLRVPPEVQDRSSDGLDRRDAIYEVEPGHKVWDRILHDFGTWFVVFEFKNLDSGPGKQDVEQLNQYLFENAKRSFGILCSRYPVSESGLKARESATRSSSRMILLLNDKDFEEMLRYKASGHDPAEIIEKKAAEFLRKLNP